MAQTLSCPVPSGLDFLTSNGFQLNITKIPNVAYFCQTANLPALSLDILEFKTPLDTVHAAGTQLHFGDLEVQFMVDSQMNNYAALLGWMQGLGFPQDWQQYTDFVTQQKSGTFTPIDPDSSPATLIILGTNGRPIRSIEFINLLPKHLTGTEFVNTANDVRYVGVKASFAYDYFTLT